MESEKIKKLNCDFCGKEIECPENMLGMEKHVCFECFKTKGKEIEALKEGKFHVDIPTKELEASMPQMLADGLTEELFPRMWTDEKEGYKHMSKKELAKLMFHNGALCMFESMRQMGEDAEDKGAEEAN